ncbi:MAG TPA: pyridine nucleotide-disulfide oxidoreductase, partial [Sporomusaceae bacterium]|nr:pyridine nucleotide-disulfide oxidoreductase [Sporomusaceae bacterium]
MHIIGGGPAGLTAAIYGARARLKTAILEKGAVGGQAFTTREIVNFPGFASTSGPALMKTLAEHAKSFGAQIITEEVTSVE